MPMFYYLLILFLLGLVGLVLVVSTPPGVGSLVGLSLVVVSLFGALGGGFILYFIFSNGAWGPGKEIPEDRHSPDYGIRLDS